MDEYAQPYTKGLIIKNTQYVCPVHGEIDNATLSSNIPGFEMYLCLRCYLEKLVEIGVKKVEEKNT